MVERSAGVGIHILQVTILGVGSYLAYLGQITIGSLAAFQALFLSLSYSLSYVTQFAPSLLLAAGGMRRIEDLLSEEPEVVDDREGTSPLAAPAREIAFEEVAFSYGGGQLNLDHVTFRIPPGTSAAFVGSSGAGKSTVLNLLMRFYDPQAGKSGLAAGACAGSRSNPCARASASSSRRTYIFDTTLRENIRVGKPGASEAEVEAAARAAEIHDFITGLPQAYDTVVGERGGRLSGGERQRIAIARAILRDPAILVLDEATSALDPATEAALNATLARVARGRTVVAVTHRLQSVTGVDRIFVLDHGRLVEEGPHAELLERRRPLPAALGQAERIRAERNRRFRSRGGVPAARLPDPRTPGGAPAGGDCPGASSRSAIRRGGWSSSRGIPATGSTFSCGGRWRSSRRSPAAPSSA